MQQTDLRRRLLVVVLGIGSAAGAAAGCGAGYRGSTAMATLASPGAAASPISPAADLAEQRVVEGTLRVEVGDHRDLIAGLRAQLALLGGRIVEEELAGTDADWQARIKLRVLPQHVETVVSWLDGRGDILEKNITASDVSKTLLDQDLAIKNAQLTLDRLEAILRQGGLTMQDVLAIERELTRLRGEIEALKGQSQFLKDRVAMATLEIAFSQRSETVQLARAKAYPGVRLSTLLLLDAQGEQPRTRLGGGFVIHTLFRAATFELELYRSADNRAGTDRSMSVLATFGAAMYSDFLGRGERRFGNPFLGLRTGYGYLDAHRFVVQGEAGVELFKSRRFALDASARMTGFIGSNIDAAIVLGAGAVVAF